MRTPESYSPASTASRPWQSAGGSAPTKAQSTTPTCRATSTSSCSASTAAPAPHAGAGWSSTASWSSPSRTHRALQGPRRRIQAEAKPAHRTGRPRSPARPRTASVGTSAAPSWQRSSRSELRRPRGSDASGAQGPAELTPCSILGSGRQRGWTVARRSSSPTLTGESLVVVDTNGVPVRTPDSPR